MQPGVIRTLEFERIVEGVRSFAATPMGDERLVRLAPSTEPDEVARLLAATSETAGYTAKYGNFPLRGSLDLSEALGVLAIDGRPLEPLRLLALVTFLDSLEQTRAAIGRTGSSFPLLVQASQTAASFKREVQQVREKLAPSGEVLDDASSGLKLIRDRLQKQRTRLRGILESYLRGRETAKYLQDQVITERNGRYVLVVRAEHRSSLPGIVHGTSTSGASLFLEPLSTVEINNDIVALEEQEAEEIRRILLALTALFRGRPADLRRTLDVAAELDVRQARARYSQSIEGVEPQMSTDGAFELNAARHPLLKQPVPVTIRLVPPEKTLLVTGPNTGGKTVALKTAGLLALMAQAGLHIPAADGSRLPVFQSIFADIGDEQSIEASLSTFSSHIANIAAMDRGLAVPALVLLDEVGSGTDPVEGGALGVAIVDHFRKGGATVIATSHHDALKVYASTAEGVGTAAFGFDTDTFAPTYRLIYGSPGRSLALEIAGRLGLNPEVVAAARRNLSARETQLAEHLAKIDRDMRALEHQHRLATRERETLEAAEVRMRQREETLRQREETFRRRLNEELEEQVRAARREIDAVIAALKTKTSAMAREAVSRTVTTADTGTARGDARAAIDSLVERFMEPSRPIETPDAATAKAPAVGDRVFVGGFALEGVVTTIHDGNAEVDVRGKRMRASVRDLRVLGCTIAGPRVNVHVELQSRETALAELNVIGCRVDEAIARAERFLDESLLTDHHTLRVIHGFGTGQLKRALAGFLQQHPLVSHFAAAPPEQGGGGVTVVELKE